MVLPQGALDGLQCVIVVFPDHTIFWGPSMRPNRGLGNRGEGHLFHGNWGPKAKF